MAVLGRWEEGQSQIGWEALTGVTVLRLEKMSKPGCYLPEEHFRQREEQLQRPGGRHVPGEFGDQCLSDNRAESGRKWCQRSHEKA